MEQVKSRIAKEFQRIALLLEDKMKSLECESEKAYHKGYSNAMWEACRAADREISELNWVRDKLEYYEGIQDCFCNVKLWNTGKCEKCDLQRAISIIDKL